MSCRDSTSKDCASVPPLGQLFPALWHAVSSPGKPVGNNNVDAGSPVPLIKESTWNFVGALDGSQGTLLQLHCSSVGLSGECILCQKSLTLSKHSLPRPADCPPLGTSSITTIN